MSIFLDILLRIFDVFLEEGWHAILAAYSRHGEFLNGMLFVSTVILAVSNSNNVPC